MSSLATLSDAGAGLALVVLIAVFGGGRGGRIERLWVLKRYEIVLTLALPAASRFLDAAGQHRGAEDLRSAQVGALILVALRLVISLARGFQS